MSMLPIPIENCARKPKHFDHSETQELMDGSERCYLCKSFPRKMPSMKIENHVHESGFTAIGSTLSTVGPEIILVNPENRDYTRYRGNDSRGSCFVLCFGAYGWTKLMVWENNLQDALDTAVDWIAEHAPGLLCTNEVNTAHNEAMASGMTEEEAWDSSEIDVTRAGNCGDCISSSEWGISLENPTRAELVDFLRLWR